MYALNYIISERIPKLIALPMIFTFLFFSIKATFKYINYPLTPYAESYVIPKVAKWFNLFCDPRSKIYYSHPTLMLYLERDPFDKKQNNYLSSINPDIVPDKSIPMYLFWDSQYSESDMGVKLETLKNSKGLRLVLHPEENYGFNMYVFEVIR